MGRVGTVVPILGAPAEALRLLEEWRTSLPLGDAATQDWILPSLGRLADGIRSGTVPGALWVGPKDEAVGLATWTLPAELGVRASVYLSPEFRHSSTLGGFVAALDRLACVRLVDGPILGMTDPSVTHALAHLGFSAVQRIDMRFPEDVRLPEVPSDPALPLQALDVQDEARIGDLLARAYADVPVERALFARYRDPMADGRQGARELLHGEVGTWRPEASFGVRVGDRLVAATLVNDFLGPLLTEVVTDPEWRRRGLARRLLQASVRAIRSSGSGPPRLVVTVGNDRAQRVYRAFGFVEDPTTLGTLWLRASPP